LRNRALIFESTSAALATNVNVPRPNSAALVMKWEFGADPSPTVKRRLRPRCSWM
jgi:hypothetical protein